MTIFARPEEKNATDDTQISRKDICEICVIRDVFIFVILTLSRML
jgi:hypothetical protein